MAVAEDYGVWEMSFSGGHSQWCGVAAPRPAGTWLGCFSSQRMLSVRPPWLEPSPSAFRSTETRQKLPGAHLQAQ